MLDYKVWWTWKKVNYILNLILLIYFKFNILKYLYDLFLEFSY